jgi:hypothetical protein
MQPEMREALLGLVDDVEHGRVAVMHVVRHWLSEKVTTDADGEEFWPIEFPWALEKLTGGATVVFDHAAQARGTTSLVIQDEPPTCSAGHPRDGAFTAHFTLFVSGEQKADWKLVVQDEYELFAAATGNPSNADGCVHVMP